MCLVFVQEKNNFRHFDIMFLKVSLEEVFMTYRKCCKAVS